MAITLKPTIIISNKAIYTFITIVVLLITSGIVVAYNADWATSPGNPAVHGHSPDEVELSIKVLASNFNYCDNNDTITCPSGYKAVACSAPKNINENDEDVLSCYNNQDSCYFFWDIDGNCANVAEESYHTCSCFPENFVEFIYSHYTP